MRYLVAVLIALSMLCIGGGGTALADGCVGVCGSPPPPPPPPPSGTTITLTDATWTCNQPLADYGPLPITVVVNYTRSDYVEFGAKLAAGCSAVRDGVDDLILEINGGSRSSDPANGPYGDCIRITAQSPGAHDIDVSGWCDTGRGRPANHNDGVQAIGGSRITFHNFDLCTHGFNGQPSCHGAGAGFFWSSTGCPTNCIVPIELKIEDSVVGACSTGLRASAYSDPGDAATNVVVRHGSDPNDPESCLTTTGAKYSGGPCYPPATPDVIAFTNVTCDAWPFD